jgi:septal ring factor EnvC (AmiA/AmiB activator)
MRRRLIAPIALLCLLGSGAALAVNGTPTGPLDALSQRNKPAAKAKPRTLSPTDVEIALKALLTEKAELESETTDIASTLAAAEARVNARGRTYYKQLRAGMLPVGGGFDELVDHAARVERNHLSIRRDLELVKQLRKRRDEIELRLHAIDADRAPLAAQKKAWDSAKAYLRQADERRAAFDRAFGSSMSPPEAVTVYGREVSPGEAPTGVFASLHGTLPMPLAGRTEVRVVEGSSGPGTAVELHSARGATARAVANGRVVFVDRDEWDRLAIILDHGERYFTVYSNMQASEVKVGESVQTGSALGPVVEVGGEAVLTFELRKEGRAVAASPWFGL